LNNNPDEFQFAIVSDRTGGHRAKIFSRAIDQLNLMQPEFVVSVGDLIEGYTHDNNEIDRQWREFQSYTSRLQMPFFYVVGNHDISNKTMAKHWGERFGRTYYEFLYKNVLFLALSSEDEPGNDKGKIGADQLAWLKKVLDENKDVRTTLVFLHKPMWVMPEFEKNNWLEVEKLLAGRKYSVFAGHVHRYQKFVRNGQNYYMLGTTGGVSLLRGVEYGEVDHVTWVTMKKEGPLVANILLNGILREDLAIPPSEEEAVREYYQRPTQPLTIKVLYDGKPPVGAEIEMRGPLKESRQVYVLGNVEADGSARMSTYQAFDGAPVGEYTVTITWRKPYFTLDGKLGPNHLPVVYANAKTTPLKLIIKTGVNNPTLELK
jgi:predicted phosphodiesterase